MVKWRIQKAKYKNLHEILELQYLAFQSDYCKNNVQIAQFFCLTCPMIFGSNSSAGQK